MSAASVLSHHQAAPGAPNTFSALTLFESTLLNAGMLLDSMTLDELVAAVRLICNLQHQAVDVMQPCAGQVQSTNRQLQEQLQQLQQQQQHQQRQHQSAASCSSASSPPAAKRPCKMEPKEPSVAVKLEQHLQPPLPPPHVDSFASDLGGASFVDEDEDDDCLLLEEESSFGVGLGVSGASGASASSGGVDVRNLLKDTYKNLRGCGPHLFDFAKPFEHPVNQTVAKKVIDQAQATSGITAGAETWRKRLTTWFNSQSTIMIRNRKSAKKSSRLRNKLSRRQKAFETLLPNLSPDDLEQYRIVLTRDLTSSDEEEEDETLRVRCLAWESARVRDIKRNLDEAFMRRFATVKQRAQLSKCVRDDSVRSQRPIPPGTPEWVIGSAFLP